MIQGEFQGPPEELQTLTDLFLSLNILESCSHLYLNRQKDNAFLRARLDLNPPDAPPAEAGEDPGSPTP